VAVTRSHISVGEKLQIKGRNVTVTPLDATSVESIRGVLVALAKRSGTTTYGDLKVAAGLPHPATGLGRVLDLVRLDCERRGEPPLDALVVSQQTGEVSDGHGPRAGAQRDAVYRHWR
jgi:hypothetical protein